MLYLDHYGMIEKPFQDTANPRFLWLGENQLKALSVLKDSVRKNRSIALLSGDIGSGKTILVNYVARLLKDRCVIAKIDDPDLQRLDFLNRLGEAYRLPACPDNLKHFYSQLDAAGSRRHPLVVILEEAHRLQSDLRKMLDLLLEARIDELQWLNLIMAIQSRSENLTALPDMEGIVQKASVQCHLPPLTEAETAEYIKHQLNIAGAVENLFSPEAIREVYRFSEGVPRVINSICDHALVVGYSKNCAAIEASLLKESAEDLQILN